jgi:RNA polymerase sigma factor (sigma-70 family)
MTDSQQLLDQFVRSGSDLAFRELVARYVDLVYSTAFRLVDGNAHQAQDVAQEVFVDLARQAPSLPNDVQLGGWLHRHTCFVASHFLRRERRRQFRERQAVEMNALNDTSGLDFRHIAAVLDEAVNELEEADRTAVVLRFYEQRDFRAVGQALGSNEDAARMRVNRALEKLEGLLKRRGVTTTGAALAAVLAAHVVQAAPAGLATALSTGALAGTAAATSTALAATKVIAMTTLQKTLLAATLLAVAGAGIYEANRSSKWHQPVQQLEQQPTRSPANETTVAALQEKVEQLTSQKGELTAALAKANAEKVQLALEREQAKRSAALYKQLVEQADATATNPTNLYPSTRHVWAALGRFARLTTLWKEDQSKLSAEEKEALETEKLKALAELPRLVKAWRELEATHPTGANMPLDEQMDMMTCMFYGALNLDEPQFGQVYGLMQGLQDEMQQKGLSWTNAAPENVQAFNQLVEHFKGEMPRLLTPEQAKIFTSLMPLMHFQPGATNGFNFNFNY